MRIGQRIRELRRQRKITLTKLADITGIQIATLSRIEHDKMTGTLASHIKIANALRVELTALYETLSQSNAPDPEKKNSGVNAETFAFNEKASYEILANNVMTKKMMPIVMRIEPKGTTAPERSNPGSERFIFVLKGVVTVLIGEKTFTLKPNHSLYFDASTEHRFENHGEATAKFISVITPATI